MESPESLPSLDKEKILRDILARCEKDQAMRKKWAENNFNQEFYDADLDIANQKWIKETIDQLEGWPKISEFGEAGADAFWVLVQHTPDLELMKEMLIEMQQLSGSEINTKNIAKTTDRIQIREGKGQLYGTSYTLRDGVFSVDPIEDEEHIDERRFALGLDSFAEQKERAFSSYEEHLKNNDDQ
jgi:hypothetical protein